MSTNDRIQGQKESHWKKPENPGYRYVVIERITYFDLDHGRSSPANAFTEATLRSAEPAIGQKFFQESSLNRKFKRAKYANKRAKEGSDQFTQKYHLPGCAHHEGLRPDGTSWYVMVLHDGSVRYEVDVVRRWEVPGQVILGQIFGV
ncbi:MAG: hypothetical protein L6R37_007088 [Teloschistes peruensis]|nr:MAG: hypothetical protein L6R37_007088 [Teloschistes peruensis]